MRLEPARLVLQADRVRVEATLVSRTRADVLWFEVDRRWRDYVLVDRLDAFAVLALILAMERHEPLEIEGAISERLAHNLEHQVKPIVRLVVPELYDSPVSAATLDSRGQPRGPGVGTGFSGGIDSFCTIADYFSQDTSPGYRLTHLLYCDVGAHPGEVIREGRWNLIKDFGEAIGLDLVRISSNIQKLMTTTFERTHMLRNASAALLLQGLFGKYLYSSGFSFRDCHIREGPDIACADPALVHQLSTESFEAISTGCQYTRVEKTRKAVAVPHIRRFLNVCNHPNSTARNCSRCYKCLRTLSTLELLGELEGFEHLFDMDVYRRHRAEYLMLMPGRTNDAFIKEIFEFSRHPDAKVPRNVALTQAIWPVIGVPYKLARNAKRLLSSARRG
jgi:hypothetical protein